MRTRLRSTSAVSVSVEQQHRAAVAEVIRGIAGGTHRRGNGGGDQRWVSDLREVDEPRPILAIGRLQLGGDLQPERRLADAARPCDRDQPGPFVANHPQDVRDGSVAADGMDERGRQVGAAEAVDGRELGMPSLVEAHLADILQPVDAQVRDVGVLEQIAGALRKHHLPGIRGGRDPRGAVHVEADVVVTRQLRLARVQAHPHTHRVGQSVLALTCCGERIGCPAERDEEAVALRAHLCAPVVGERRPQRLAVCVERLAVGIADLVQQRSRPDDVGEEQGDSAGRQAHRVSIPPNLAP